MWLDLYAAPGAEIAAEAGIEVTRFGPLRALVCKELRGAPMLNLLLGAAEPAAVEQDHLGSAAEWMAGLGAAHRVPVREGSRESERWLQRAGYEPRLRLVRYLRDASPPRGDPPTGVEVDDFASYGPEALGFGSYALDAYGLPSGASLFLEGLPHVERWRTYAAIDAATERGIGAAAMFWAGEGIVQLALDATYRRSRCKGAQTALIHRRLADAAAGGARTVFAEIPEPLRAKERSTPAARNLVRAGFRRDVARTVWERAASE